MSGILVPTSPGSHKLANKGIIIIPTRTKLLTYQRGFVFSISACLYILCAYVTDVFYLHARLHACMPVCVRVLRASDIRCFTYLCAFTQLFAFVPHLWAFERPETSYQLENMVSVSMLAKSEHEIITVAVVRRCPVEKLQENTSFRVLACNLLKRDSCTGVCLWIMQNI